MCIHVSLDTKVDSVYTLNEMITNTKSKASIFLVILLSLSMIGCSVSSVITDIEIAQTVLTLGAPVIAAFAGPGALLIQGYMVAASNGLSCVLTAAQAPDATTATVGAAFGTCFAAATVPVLPAGTPAYVAAVITSVSGLIKILIQKYGPHPGQSAAAPVKIKLGMADHKRIHDVESNLNAVKAQFKK